MKILYATFLAIVLALPLTKTAHAQTENARTKIELTIVFGGKTIVTELNGVATALSRSLDEPGSAPTAKDSAKKEVPAYKTGSFYLSLDVKRVSDDLLRVFSKKQNRFEGTITIVDTYGKIPTKTIKFRQAGLYSYSDNFASGYGESYGSSAMSIGCQELSINGIPIEQ